MKKMFQVFVSSTYEDLKNERNEVIKALLELNCFPLGMEYFPASDDAQWEYIKDLIQSCDYYVIIVAGKYGSELSDGMSYTEREYRFAVENNIPIIGFIHADIQSLKNKDKEPEKIVKLNSFINLVQSKLCKNWRDTLELGGLVSRSITVLKDRNPRAGWIRGNTKTDEHLNVIIERGELEKKYNELKTDLIKAPSFYEDFDGLITTLNQELDKSYNDVINKSDTLKIRILGVCCHKSFPVLRSFLEKNCHSGKRIEVRLSMLDRNCKIMKVLNDIWKSYFDVFEQELDDLVSQLNKIDGANVSIKTYTYSHMPNWHGILINKKKLFLSACIWDRSKRMTAGENHYAYYIEGSSWVHDRKITQFMQWFDYTRFDGITDKKIITFDTKNN